VCADAFPDDAAEVLRARLESGESVMGEQYVRVLRNMALAASLPPDVVRKAAGELAGGGVDGGCPEAVMFLCDAFRNYTDQVVEAMKAEGVVARAAVVFEGLAVEMKAAVVILLFNYACYSVNETETLAEVAEALAGISVESLGTIDNEIFVRACHVCVVYSPEAVERLKRAADVIRQVHAQTEGTRELLADVIAKLEQ
jgi:hypothetical protein